MQDRINIQQTAPKAYAHLLAFENYMQGSEIDKTHLELIKIRASQVNGCAFCINMHTQDALNQGETAQRIFLLNAWRETSLFTAEERVILAMTEEVTLISKGGLSDDTYSKAKAFFGETYLAHLLLAITLINAWNRVAISTNRGV